MEEDGNQRQGVLLEGQSLRMDCQMSPLLGFNLAKRKAEYLFTAFVKNAFAGTNKRLNEFRLNILNYSPCLKQNTTRL